MEKFKIVSKHIRNLNELSKIKWIKVFFLTTEIRNRKKERKKDRNKGRERKKRKKEMNVFPFLFSN
jgi:hypothetical protein